MTSDIARPRVPFILLLLTMPALIQYSCIRNLGDYLLIELHHFLSVHFFDGFFSYV